MKLNNAPTGGLKELLALSVPMILSLFSGSLMLMCNRLFLARYSLEALEGCIAAGALLMMFQIFCTRITSLSQAFVGFFKGSEESHRIGETLWQMIWFSILSTLITLPLGYLSSLFFFSNSPLSHSGLTYFQILILFNFLFPLGNTLSTFYLGQGFTKLIVIANLCAQTLNIFLDYLLIFGFKPFLPPLGLTGAAIATVLSQSLLCLFLFLVFIQKSNHQLYGTEKFRLKPKLFWTNIKLGLPRAIARLNILAVWACNAHMMMGKGATHLLILSIGSTLFGTFLFINDGMSQAIITIASKLIGARDWLKIWKLLRSALLFVSGTLTLLSLPLLVYPKILLDFFFREAPLDFQIPLLYKTCGWIWLLIFGNAVNLISISFLTASRDTTFHMMTNSLSWIICYLPVLYLIDIKNYPADKFWLILTIEPFILAFIIFLRLRQERWKYLTQSSGF